MPDLDWHERFKQQAGWTRPLREYLFSKVNLAGAGCILEVGCGTGAILMETGIPDMSTRNTGNVYGLDIDLARLTQAAVNVPDARLVCGDALRLPHPAGCFEVAFCHFLLLWVKDPLQVLREMRRVTKPGGSVLALAEPDHGRRVDEPRSLGVLGKWQRESLIAQGADPDIGSRLGNLFEQAGLQVVEFGEMESGKANQMNAAERELEWQVMEFDLGGRVPGWRLERLKKLDERAWLDGKRVLQVPTYFAWGKA